MTVFFLDSSVVIRALLDGSRSAAAWMNGVTSDPAHIVVASRLLRTEVTRVLRREGLPVALRDAAMDPITLVPLTEGVLAAAEAIESRVRALDAIHLGSVIAAGLDATIVTHDRAMAAAAEALGYATFDPVEES